MKKPRNKTSQHRLHYLGVLAAAGLLAIGTAGPVMAQSTNEFGNGTNIINGSDYTSGSSASIVSGSPVEWDLTSLNAIDGLVFSGPNIVITENGGTSILATIDGALATAANIAGTLNMDTNGLSIGQIEVASGGSIILEGTGNVTVTGTADGMITFSGTGTNTVAGAIGSLADTTVTVTNNLTANGTVGDAYNGYTTTFNVNAGNSLDQSAGLASGTIYANNDIGNSASALTLGSLNTATVNSGNAVTLTGTESGSTNTLTGGGSFEMDVAGFGGNDLLNVAGSKLLLNDQGGSGGSSVTNFINLDSSAADSSLANNAGAALNLTGTSLIATVGSGDAVVNTGAGLAIGGLVGLTGTGAGGVFEVANGAIDLSAGDGLVFIDGDLTINFNHGAGFTGVNELYTGILGNNTKVSFANADDYLAVTDLNVVSGTVFNTNMTLAATAPTSGSGVYVDAGGDGALNIGATMTMADNTTFTVESGTSSPTNPAINFTGGGAAYTDLGGNGYGTAIVLATAADAVINGTVYFDVADVDATLQIIGALDGTDMSAAWSNFEYAGAGYSGYGTAAISYNMTNGILRSLSSSSTIGAIDSAPKYGRGYVNALMYNNLELADAIGNGYFNPGVDSFMAPDIADNTATGHRVLNMAMGNTLSAVHMVTNNALLPIMNNLNTTHPQTEHRLARSAGESETFGLWLTPNFSYRSVDGDYARGYGSDVDIKNYGMTLGFDGWLHEQFRAGLFFGFNHGELDGSYQNIDSDDVQLGAYGQASLPRGIMLNLGLAYGWQDYDSNRKVVTGVSGYDQRIKSDFDGSTVTAAVELNKTFPLENNMFLRPAIGYTYLGVDLDAYREKSNAAAGFSLAQKADETNYDLHLVRVGADIGWTEENISVIGRAYYVGNAGDTEVQTRSRLISAPQAPFTILGAEYDSSMANLGLTLKLAPTVNTHVALDYDALFGSKSESHNVNLTFKYEW